MAGSPPKFHKMDSRSACIQGVIKVKVKGHVIRALLCWHENRLFSHANGPIATKLAHDSLRVSLHPGCAQGKGQGQRSRDTRTFLDSWNELLRHWRSGSITLCFTVGTCNYLDSVCCTLASLLRVSNCIPSVCLGPTQCICNGTRNVSVLYSC